MSAAAKADAQRTALQESQMPLRQALKVYKKALFWTAAVSGAIIMESYDTMLINSFFAYPTFLQKFGDELPNGSHSIPADWQTALGLGASIGIIVGIFANGILIDQYGHILILLVSLVCLSGFIALTFCATSRSMLLIGQILCGFPWGTINTIAVSYAIETAPLSLRAYGPTFVNLCWVIGHIIGAGVLKGMVDNTTVWSWKLPFALQWVFPLPLFIIFLFAPHSPWWLIRKGRHEDAIKTLDRLSDGSVDNVRTAAVIKHTIELEQSLNFGSSYWDCFKGVDLRRTEIAGIVWISQCLVGFAMQNYQTYFFTLAGLASSDAFKLALGTYSIAFVGTCLSIPLQSRFGRRDVWLYGLLWMLACMAPIGFLALAKQTTSIKWAQAILLLLWFFGYGWSAGPLPYVICSEVGSATLRQKTISIARGTYYVLILVNAIVSPYMLNPTKGNLKGKAAFVPMGLEILILIWSYFRLPETKGRSFEELDLLFAKGVPARKFKTTVIEPAEHIVEHDDEKYEVENVERC